MVKYIAMACVLVLAALLVYLLYQKHIRQERYSNGISYNLTSDDVERLKSKSENGDCNAAYRLALYYMYGSLQPDDGLKWLRVAAKCPDANPKEYLIFLLSINKDDPQVAKEMSRLVEEIRDIDPARATEVENRLGKQK